MPACECEGLEGLELAKCLAPPRGDYELDIPITNNLSLIITSSGLILKQVVIDDDLPFARTVERRVPDEYLEHVNLKVKKEELPCLAAKALLQASSHGSEVSREKVKRCRRIIEEVSRNC